MRAEKASHGAAAQAVGQGGVSTPAIVPEGRYDLWIDRKVQEPAELAPVLRPYPAEEMRAFQVGRAVNDPRNDGPGCLAPAG
jgi:putative SOS response-associated peptidase YedK